MCVWCTVLGRILQEIEFDNGSQDKQALDRLCSDVKRELVNNGAVSSVVDKLLPKQLYPFAILYLGEVTALTAFKTAAELKAVHARLAGLSLYVRIVVGKCYRSYCGIHAGLPMDLLLSSAPLPPTRRDMFAVAAQYFVSCAAHCRAEVGADMEKLRVAFSELG